MSEAAPVWTVQLQGGRVLWDRPRDVADYCHSLGNCAAEVIIRRRRSKRSDAQNRAWWGLMLPAIATGLGHDRRNKADMEALHYALVRKCFGVRIVAGEEVPNVKSSQSDTKTFSELMEWAARFAAEEWGIFVPLPDDVDTEAA